MRTAWWVAVALAASALLVACGGGTGGGGETIDAGLPAIELVAPAESGGGEVPVFEWKPVDGAVRYRLVVVDSGGAPLWSWSGSETTVRLGGLLEEPAEGTPGPVISAGSSWSVVAFGADGAPLAVSTVRPVSP